MSKRRSVEASKRYLMVSLMAGLAFASPLHAQDIQLGDTLGANFDITQPGTGGPDLFDYLVGEWDFRFQAMSDNGRLETPRRGHWRTWKSHDNLMVEDEWAVEPPPGRPRRLTITYRAYNPERRLWEIMGVVPGVGRFEPGTAWGSGSERYLIQHYGDFVVRIKYYQITRDHFLWRADGSNDGGRTWVKDIWRMEATRTR